MGILSEPSLPTLNTAPPPNDDILVHPPIRGPACLYPNELGHLPKCLFISHMGVRELAKGQYMSLNKNADQRGLSKWV